MSTSRLGRQPTAGRRTRAFAFPLPTSLALEQGARGYLVQSERLPLVHLRMTLLAGHASDLPKTPGAAYATSQMLEEGAGRRSALQVAAEVQQLGASMGTWAEADTSTIGLHLLRRHLDRGLDLLADLVLRPHLASSDWRRVREELRDRAVQRRAHPEESAKLALRRMVYGEHPYARPSLALPDELGALGIGDLRAFHRAHYLPQNAIFVAAGAVSAGELEGKLNQRFAAWRPRPGKPQARPRSLSARSASPRLGLVTRDGAPQSVLRVGHLAPPRHAVDYAGLRVLNTVLGGSFTSRLNLNLREKHGFTYGVHSSFSLLRREGLFSVQTSVGADDTLAALHEIHRELRLLTQKPVSGPELAKAKELVIETLPAQAETLEGLVEAHSVLTAHDLPLSSLAQLPQEVASVTAGRLRELASQMLHPDHTTVVVVGDLNRLAEPLQRAYGRAVLLDADGQPA